MITIPVRTRGTELSKRHERDDGCQSPARLKCGRLDEKNPRVISGFIFRPHILIGADKPLMTGRFVKQMF